MSNKIYPKLLACIICEQVRAEPGSKSTILGFFGVSPKVELQGDIASPIETLTFILILSEVVKSSYKTAIEILDQDNKPISLTQDGETRIEKEANLTSTQPTLHMNLVFKNLRFPSYGTYTFRLTFDNKVIANEQFSVSKQRGTASQ